MLTSINNKKKIYIWTINIVILITMSSTWEGGENTAGVFSPTKKNLSWTRAADGAITAVGIGVASFQLSWMGLVAFQIRVYTSTEQHHSSRVGICLPPMTKILPSGSHIAAACALPIRRSGKAANLQNTSNTYQSNSKDSKISCNLNHKLGLARFASHCYWF